MQSIEKRVEEFLKAQDMSYNQIDPETYCEAFIAEMQRGLAGENSSLAMLPTYLEATFNVPRNEKVIVLDAGGTNFRVATIFFNESGQAVIENFQKYPMPGARQELDKESFFRLMADYMKEVLHLSRKIGFCFSYPVEMLPSKDGRVIQFSKEIKAPEVEGELVGEGLVKALRLIDANLEFQSVVVLNDTAATLLAGRAVDEKAVFSSYLGFILGTGTNLCYIEKNSQITKARGLNPAQSQLINMESGGFNKIPQGKIDRIYDQTTKNPGVFTFEKMISGRYLGGLCQMLLRAAAADGLFSTGCREQLERPGQLTTVEINQFLKHPYDPAPPLGDIFSTGTEEDRVTAYYLLDAMVERAAKYTAISISGAILKSGQGLSPDAPVCVMAEGTTFYHLKSLKAKTEYYLYDYLVKKRHRYYEFATIENATLIGAAIAGLTN